MIEFSQYIISLDLSTPLPEIMIVNKIVYQDSR